LSNGSIGTEELALKTGSACYGIFQTYEIVAELFLLAYLVKEGFKKLWK
jgi:hypothetical protein